MRVAGPWLLVVLLAWTLAACGMPASTSGARADVLLFNGEGTSVNDVAALERLLAENRIGYATAGSRQLDAMTDAELSSYRLLLVPGGNFEQIGKGLAPQTTARLRASVGNGLGYLGICAGAFFAGKSPYNGLDLASGVRFPFYALEDRGIRKAAVTITSAAGPPLDHYWEDGPQLAGWGDVVARYPDGTPAVVQGTYGRGTVILSGVHPEAPENWRHGLTFTTPVRESNAYAVRLIEAALHGRRLPHF